MSGTMLKRRRETGPPGLAHTIGLVGAWIVLTGFAETILFVFGFASTIAVFSVAGPLPTLVGIAFAVLALAGCPLACAYLVRRGDRWLSAER